MSQSPQPTPPRSPPNSAMSEESASPPHSSENFEQLPRSVSSPYPLDNKLGALHLTPCTLEQYLDIDTSVFGSYEFVDGFLVAIPMAEDEHDELSGFMLNKASARYIRGENAHSAVAQAGTAIPSTSSSSPSGSRTERVRRPDLSTAPSLSKEQRQQLSPNSQKITHPLGAAPHSVVEITSTNESTDTVTKVEEYEKAGVSQYIILNRDANCKKKEKRDKRIEIYKRNPETGKFNPKLERRGNETVDLGEFGSHTVDALFHCPKASQPLDEISQLLRSKDESLRSKDESLRSEDESLRSKDKSLRSKDESLAANARIIDALHSKLRQATLQKKHYKRQLKRRDANASVSSSSSSSMGSAPSSPHTEKNRIASAGSPGKSPRKSSGGSSNAHRDRAANATRPSSGSKGSNSGSPENKKTRRGSEHGSHS